jgi:GNAT superfamily N-acetyltransferase
VPEQLRIERLTAQHTRSSFASGATSLDHYLREQIGQDVRRLLAAAFVLANSESHEVFGYYTLSATSIVASELPHDVRRRLARYPTFPATLLGRLAVDVRLQGQGYGQQLLVDALRRALRHSANIAAMAVVVDAIDDAAVSYYLRHGFTRFESVPARLYIPMSVVAGLVRAYPTP